MILRVMFKAEVIDEVDEHGGVRKDRRQWHHKGQCAYHCVQKDINLIFTLFSGCQLSWQ